MVVPADSGEVHFVTTLTCLVLVIRAHSRLHLGALARNSYLNVERLVVRQVEFLITVGELPDKDSVSDIRFQVLNQMLGMAIWGKK